MAPKAAPSPFQSVIRTRTKNKDVHPGEPHNALTNKRRSAVEMKEAREQELLETQAAQKKQADLLNNAAAIEDELCQQDIKRVSTSCQGRPATVPAFCPVVVNRVEKTLMDADKGRHKRSGK